MTETGSTVERLQTEVVLMELDGHVPTLVSDIRAVLAVVEAAQELHDLLGPALFDPPQMRKLAKSLAALHSQASDEGKA